MTGAQAYSKRPRARNCRGEAASSRAEAGGEVFSVGQLQARYSRREAAGRGTRTYRLSIENKQADNISGWNRSVALSHKAIIVFVVANVKSTHRCYKKGLHNLKNSATCFPCLRSNPCNMTSYTMFCSTELLLLYR